MAELEATRAVQEVRLTSAFSETLLGFMFAQTFKTALDNGLATVAKHQFWPDFWADILTRPRENLFGFLQVSAFLLTLSRFYAGTYRFQKEEAGRDPSLAAAFHDAGWMVFLFVSFYLAATFVAKDGLFLLVIAGVHLIDIVWFSLSGTRGHKPYVSAAISLYRRWDLVTVSL